MVDVFIVGSKGIPAKYGGFETFVDNLTARKKNNDIHYHVSCMSNEGKHYLYNDADCFDVKCPVPGAPGRIAHVGLVLEKVEKWIESHPGSKTIVYILGCRVGPLLIPHAKKLHSLGAIMICNPDGLEWKRSKWSKPAKLFLKYCESCLVKNSDYIICDSVNIENYIKSKYKEKSNKTMFIAYGANVAKSHCSDEDIEKWYRQHAIKPNEYYLIVGRFVPENNYETMIREFMKSKTDKNLVIISNVENNQFYKNLIKETSFDQDKRIKFVGTVYNTELLKKIREGAYAYIHGHEVGGTNPSLLEALASTNVNLLLKVGFNKEVGKNSALYWDKKPNSLSELINHTEDLSDSESQTLGYQAKKRIQDDYSWDSICNKYERVFLSVLEQ